MICRNADECINEIIAFNNDIEHGYPLLVNIDDYSIYKSVIEKITADSTTKIIKVSDYGKGDGFSNYDSAISEFCKADKAFLIGISTYLMLLDEEILIQTVDQLCSISTNGHAVILLNGCSRYLRNLINHDIRLEKRTVLVESAVIELPKIYITDTKENCNIQNYCDGLMELVKCLECASFYRDNVCLDIVVITKYRVELFQKSRYAIYTYGGAFEAIEREFPSVRACIEKKWGTSLQWGDVYSNLLQYKTLSAMFEAKIGATTNLSSFIEDDFENIDSDEAWYLWLAMKTLGTKENDYLSITVKNSSSVGSLVRNIVMELLNHKSTDKDFTLLYNKRKRLVEHLNGKEILLKEYCNQVGRFEKEAVWYLSDISDDEKLYFLKFINEYGFTTDEIMNVAKMNFPELFSYLSRYKFMPMNTVVPTNDNSIYDMLTDYFDEYKIQKLTNTIHPEFMDKVNDYALSRPFYKLSPRSSIMSKIDKTKAQLFFFDALGVEYLSFIQNKCEKYGLEANVHIGHCELPSITSQNKEFEMQFNFEKDEYGKNIIPGSKDLDEIKHHSEKFDYRDIPEPLYLFSELEVIDKQISKIKKDLSKEKFNKVILVSDHGASRLSVIHQTESKLHLVEEGQAGHSGRCCTTSVNPNVPEAVYDNGYAVLANYDRFKGSRKSNVEVHGGATLEETVIPIIEITKKPQNEEVYIVPEYEYIEFHKNDVISIIIYSSTKLSSASIIIHEIEDARIFCDPSVDGHNFKFSIPQIKRSGIFTVDLYDGSVEKAKNLSFKAKKATATENKLF